MPVAEAAAAAKVRGASGRGLLWKRLAPARRLGGCRLSRLLASRMPLPQAGCRFRIPENSRRFLRFLRFARIFAEFSAIRSSWNFALDALVIVLGLTFRFLTSFCEFLCDFAAFFLTNRYSSRAEPRATIEQLHTCSVGCWETIDYA